jgi:hypothetical protein
VNGHFPDALATRLGRSCIDRVGDWLRQYRRSVPLNAASNDRGGRSSGERAVGGRRHPNGPRQIASVNRRFPAQKREMAAKTREDRATRINVAKPNQKFASDRRQGPGWRRKISESCAEISESCDEIAEAGREIAEAGREIAESCHEIAERSDQTAECADEKAATPLPIVPGRAKRPASELESADTDPTGRPSQPSRGATPLDEDRHRRNGDPDPGDAGLIASIGGAEALPERSAGGGGGSQHRWGGDRIGRPETLPHFADAPRPRLGARTR